MHKRMYPVAALVLLLSLGGAMAVRAAGTTVSMVDGSGDPTTTWKFDPADITVAAGSVVTWQNKGQQPHTVTADDGSFTSDYIAPNGTFQHTFASGGDFAYHCTPHPWMKAVVHVTGGSTPATAATTTTTAPAGGSSASTTTTTTTKPGTVASSTTATTAAPGAATTSTTAAAAGGTTTTTAVAASTGGASSAATPENNSTTTTTPGEHQSAASRGGSHEGKTDAPQAVLAGILTLLLAALTLRLLSAKS
jgi:plastocyanin